MLHCTQHLILTAPQSAYILKEWENGFNVVSQRFIVKSRQWTSYLLYLSRFKPGFTCQHTEVPCRR